MLLAAGACSAAATYFFYKRKMTAPFKARSCALRKCLLLSLIMEHRCGPLAPLKA